MLTDPAYLEAYIALIIAGGVILTYWWWNL